VDKSKPEYNGYALKNNTHYLVYINPKLRDDIFESVLIHELLHCKQIQAGIPGLIPARYGDDIAKFISSEINSVVADIDVEEQLLLLGLHSDYIDNKRYTESLESLNEYNNKKLIEVYSVMSALNLVLIKKTSNNLSHYEEVYKALSIQDKDITIMAEGINNIIDKYGYKTPRDQIKSIRRIAILIGWRERLKIVYNGFEQDV
jgi:hypothetical protein